MLLVFSMIVFTSPVSNVSANEPTYFNGFRENLISCNACNSYRSQGSIQPQATFQPQPIYQPQETYQPQGAYQTFDPYGSCETCDPCGCFGGATTYIAIEHFASFNQIDGGGNNNFGNGSGDNTTYDLGVAIGVEIPTYFCRSFRLEVEGVRKNAFDFTDEIVVIDFPATTLNVGLDDQWRVMGNVWYDIPLCGAKKVYVGGGIGGSGGQIEVTNGTLAGQRSYSNVAWQVGFGITWDRSERYTIDLGYRYVDYGTATVNLNTIVGNNPAGSFDADLTAHQLMLAIRFKSLGSLFACR